jgi:antirestriction protein ArdC
MQGKAKNVIEAITKNILKLMKEQGSSWTKPWANKLFTSVDGYNYTGGNIIQLAFTGYKRYVWGTYKQWIKHGCQVKKDESSTKLLFIKKYIKKK